MGEETLHGSARSSLASLDVSLVKSNYGTVANDHADEAPPQSFWTRLFPSGFKLELKQILALSWPVYLAALFNFILGPISLIFCGHLGRYELDGVALAISFLNITGLSICTGLCTACDTLFAQAYGGKNRRLFGIYFQRSLLIISLSCFLCWGIHLNAEGLLLVLGQNPQVAKISADYLLFFMPGLLFNFLFQIFVKYLQNQNKVYPPVVVGAFGNVLNALGQYIAVYVLGYGIRGSAVVQALAFTAMSLGTLFYIIYSGAYKKTWTGWSWKALEHWGVFLRLAMPGLVMMCIEMWSFEIGIFLNGVLGEVELGATSVSFQIEAILYIIPLGISLACSIRVGQNLGAGNADAAKTSARVSQAFAFIVFVVSAVLLLSLRNVLPFVFTDDPAITDLVSRTIPLLVFIQFLDAITATTMGTLRGCGQQFMGAVCNFIGYLVLTVPLAVVLMFVVKVGALGFWFGLCMGITIVSVVYIIWMFRIKWEVEVVKAQKRISEFKRKRNITDNSPLLPEQQDIIATTDETEALVRSNLYLSNSLEMSMTESVDTSLTTRHKAQLIIKRSLVVLIGLVVLAVCLLIRLYVPLPRESEQWNSTEISVVVTTEI